MKKVLEVCIDSVESAQAAKAGGATRLELCGNLIIGGTTPAVSLLKAVKGETGLPVHAMVRPRFGDFLYTDREFELMLEDAAALLDNGADALVSGCLTADGDLDISRMKVLVQLAHSAGKKFTLHRAFDMCRDPMKALADCQTLGVDIILTAGQENHCLAGAQLLKKLHEAAGSVEILVGAGVDAGAIRQFRREIPEAECFHMSGKVTLQSEMRYRKPGVNMGLPGLSEYEIWRTDAVRVAQAKAALLEEI